MPKQRQTCTRCSQRRQKCDRRQPCTRCVQNNEADLCTTKWTEGYNPSVHRRYPRKPSTTVWSRNSSNDNTSDTSSPPEPPAVHPTHSVSSSSSSSGIQEGPQCFNVGRSRALDISISTLLNEKDDPAPNPALFDQSFRYVQSAGKLRDEPSRTASCFSPAAKAAEVQYLKSLLPDRDGILKIVDYYSDYMLYWIGGLYHGPSFRKQVLDACGSSSTIDLQNVDWRWLALLFSILSSSIIGCPEGMSMSWGFSVDDKVRLARLWGAASVTCLTLGNYTSKYHIHSVHAIFILHGYEHLAGSTNQWVAMRSVAIVIAKGLGLNRLGPHPDDSRIRQLNAEEKQAFINREIGRRTWATITSQEWLCSTAQSFYVVNIQKAHFTTQRPMDLDEDTMLPINDTVPSVSLVGRYFYDYAETLLEFHNAMQEVIDANVATRYAMVLKFDGEFRATCAERVPACLSPRTPPNPAWPKWVKWARTLHQASVDHKIIMLHQNFLSKSFRDVRYTYTRWACATSATNIINLYTTRDPDEPQWWVEQAFVVTAAICLLLDMFHRRTVDQEALEYYASVSKAIRWLQQFFTSSVALHGIRLLYLLLHEYNKLHPEAQSLLGPGKSCVCGTTCVPDMQRQAAPLESHDHGPIVNPEMPLSSQETTPLNFDFDIDTIDFEDLMDFLPTAEGGIDSNTFCDSIFEMANPQFC